ncbi:MAG TPA: heavy metal sensor histidine kinase [Dehalococcoidia bacterium]|nr:heavy metal sensor histidine kinase [Dehalococcoidia bacterium]
MVFRSIRLRLTLWYVAILAVILLLLSAGVYLTLERTLTAGLDDSLRTRVTLLRGLLDYSANGTPTFNLTTDPRDPNAGESFQRIVDATGKILYDNSAAFGPVPLDANAVRRALAGSEQINTTGSGPSQARVLTAPIEQDGQVVAVMQVGLVTSDMNNTLHNLLLALAVGAPLGIVLASAGGWWLSSRALGPIDRITKTAQEISGHDLSRRLNLDLPDDEVGRLARTFDGMIGRLEAMFQRQRQFTADASHELRTPLTAIRGQIEVALQRDREAADYRRVLAAVNDQVDRMTRLVGELLMLARSDAGALPLERQPVALEGLVESIVEQVSPLAAAKGLAVMKERGAPVSVVGDEDLLLQLMLNLADNAVKYTDHGSITIGWTPHGDEANVFVRDTGRGIPEDQLERIFERFHRVEEARGGERAGAGLGLAICKWIAEAHGGRIRAESNGTGSTLTVTLPLSRAGHGRG